MRASRMGETHARAYRRAPIASIARTFSLLFAHLRLCVRQILFTQFSRRAQKTVDVDFVHLYSCHSKGGDYAMAKKKAAKKTTKKKTTKKR
jgi:hypothetical protein